MPLYLNGDKVGNYLYLGSQRIFQAYLNNNLVYQMRTPFEDVTYDTAGIHTFTVPLGNKFIDVEVYGAQGHSPQATGGLGGLVTCRIAVTGGQNLYCYVGAQGTGETAIYNASDIRTSWDSVTGTSLNDRIVVAGGGGGGGYAASAWASNSANGGAGGYPNGNGGDSCNIQGLSVGNGGGGATQSSAGSAGTAGGNWYYTGGSAGSFGLGGNGGSSIGSYAGAGGAGYYGGGGGGKGCYLDNHSDVRISSAGGGGGSSYADSTYCSNIVYTGGTRSGLGLIKIKQVAS